MKLATQMLAALEAVDDAACTNDAPCCGCCANRIKPAIAGREGVTDEMVARMDWAAGLTDEQMRILRTALELINMTETVHRHDSSRQAFYWLRDGLEALP